MKLSEIVKALEAEVLTEKTDLDQEISCAFASDLISDILMCTKEPTLLLSGLTNTQIIRLSDMIELFGIVFVRGKKPSADIIQMANDRSLPLISTAYTMYRTSGILFSCGLRSCKI